MAVMEELGLRVSVQVDGVDRPEWDDPDGEQRGPTYTSNKYILSGDDEEYTIKCQITKDHSWLYERPPLGRRENGERGFKIAPTIDNKTMRGVVASAATLSGHAGAVIEGDIVYHSPNSASLLKFKFTRIKTVDENSKARVEKDVKLAQGLGLISVLIWRVLDPGVRCAGNQSATHQDPKTLSEKALKGKALSHGTSFRSVPIPAGQTVRAELVDLVPWAVFNFKYRSKDALRQEMIIPYSPAASPEPDTGIAGLSPAEMRRLAQERLQQLKEEKNTRVKRELDATDNPHVPPRAYKVQKREGGGETIDLTEDD